ncbi:MAG: DUF362 domain-containing protein [Vicinamibacteria bacterium]|nr:DUF362 domain-containing protein [Vicinamibacteria bacterium]
MTQRYGVSRRDLLKALPLAALAGAAACRRGPRPYDAARFAHPSTSSVALLPAARYDLDLSDVVGRGLALLKVDVRGKRVLLKPNLVEFERERVINTHPALIVGAAQALRRAGAAEVVVAEGPGHRRDIEYLLTATGLLDYLRDVDVRFADLNHDDVKLTALGSRFTELADLLLPVEVLRADLVVSMPKLKTHHWAGMTCSLKNLFGIVPGAVYGWPKNILHFRGIENSIVDLAATIRPGLAIVDGIVGMEGDGPIMGTPRPVGCVVMGQDLVAVDATCARVMGLRPERMGYLQMAAEFLGNLEAGSIEQRGERLERFRTPFAVLPQFANLKG